MVGFAVHEVQVVQKLVLCGVCTQGHGEAARKESDRFTMQS